MKHALKITIILLGMFLITQFLGLYVVNYYSTQKVINGEIMNVSAPELPFGMSTPPITQESDFYSILISIIISFTFAIILILILSRFKAEFLIKLWFFAVIILALGIFLNSIIPFRYSSIIALILAIPLAFLKVYRKNLLVHNITELAVYPGIAAVFVPILNQWTIIILLVIISIYDMWAVWHSGIMQKMAKYQINQLQIFSGFFVPYISNKLKARIKNMKKMALKSKEKEQKRIKVNVAILGGGDVIFPIITAGVMLKTFGILSALAVIFGATLGLSYLFFFAEKKKFYPAMPFITTGILLGLGLWLISFIF